jgi:predicted lipoprotein with Yx(FWY)xxD motif
MKRIAFVIGTAVIGLSTLTACGGGASAAPAVPNTPAQSTPSPSAPASGGAAALSTATVGNFGKVVVDGTGRTLYVYDLDTANPSKSNCDGSCATAWPPLLAGTGTPKLTGVAASAVGTVTRSDGTGRTLYVYDLDTAKPSKSNCDGSCATAWPPLLAGTGTPKLTGVAASAVGTVTRSDGTKQVTLAGWPLYYFAQDAKAGDANGQAVGGIWWVVGANGQKITTKAAATNPSGTSGY